MLKVRNLTSPRSGREVANQFVITDGAKTMFQSYDSPIIEINTDTDTITVFPAWDYSMTTGKYRNQFMSEQGFYHLSNKKELEEAITNGKYGNWKVVKAS